MININNLRKYRENANLTQTELAYKVGVTERYIAFLETGDRKPSLDVAEKVSNVLGATINDIFLNSKCTKRTYEKI